jgi:hypothetical protein
MTDGDLTKEEIEILLSDEPNPNRKDDGDNASEQELPPEVLAGESDGETIPEEVKKFARAFSEERSRELGPVRFPE